MAEASTIPLNPSLEHVPLRSIDEVDVYEIHYAGFAPNRAVVGCLGGQ